MRLLLVVLVSGCGRIAFDAGDHSSDATPDTSTDAAAFCQTGAATSCPAGALLCDDFETSSGTTFPRWTQVSLGNWNTTGPADPATSVVAGSAACRGSTGMHVHTLGSAQVATVDIDSPPRPNPLYARTWFRIAASSSVQQFELMGLHDLSSNTHMNFRADRANQSFQININGWTSTLHLLTSDAAPLKADQWMCMEIGVVFDQNAAGRVQIWLDDTPVFDATGATEGFASLDRVHVGVITAQVEPGTYDVDFDETVIAGSRIGCR